jgi:hypothetical protein
MKTLIKKLTVSSALIAVVITGCKKDPNDESPKPASQEQDLALVFKNVAGTSDVDFISAYTTNSSQKYTLSTVRFYMSGISLIKSDGSEYPLTGQYLLVDPSTSHFHLGKVPVGNYKGLKFTVGIDSVTNHKDPSTYAITNPLANQTPSMHWSWNSGYIFMMIEGSCDTTGAGIDTLNSGQYNHSMFFHLGMDMLARKVDLSNSAFTVVSGTDKYLNIKTNVNQLLNGLDLKTENQSHTMGTMMLATKVADNISTAFTLVP